MEETEEYKKIKETLLRKKSWSEDRVQKAVEKYERIEESEMDRKEVRLELAQNEITRRKNALTQIEEQLEFLRPQNEQDTEYRLKQYKEFPGKIKETVPDDLELRFHGCPINTAKHILESGGLSSSVDRLGISTSYDVEDQVSVTTKDTIETTIQGYSHLSGNQHLPAGCIFVLLPKDEEDARAGDSMLMGNVDFKAEPERLYGVITTPENIERVGNWAQEYGIDLADKLYDFESFTRSFEKEQDTYIDNPILKNAIKLTEVKTRSGKINEQIQAMKNIQKAKEEPKKETEEISK